MWFVQMKTVRFLMLLPLLQSQYDSCVAMPSIISIGLPTPQNPTESYKFIIFSRSFLFFLLFAMWVCVYDFASKSQCSANTVQKRSCKWMAMHVIMNERNQPSMKKKQLELISLVTKPGQSHTPKLKQSNAMHFLRFNKLCIIYVDWTLFAFIILNWRAMKMHYGSMFEAYNQRAQITVHRHNSFRV